jgi:hypothetical protein
VSTYTVTRLIRGAVRLGGPCEIDGIHFSPIEPFKSDQVLVSESIEANTFHNASKLFDQHLLTVADAMSVVIGAAITPGGASTLIEKKRSRYAFLLAVRRRESAALTIPPDIYGHLLDRSADAAAQLARNNKARNASHYLRQAALSETATTTAFHALQAAEALATTGNKTSHGELTSLMGSDLYAHFYAKDPIFGESRRNALAHGRMIEETGLQDKTIRLQERLLGVLRGLLGGETSPSFSPIRGFVTYERLPLFIERLSVPLDLAALVEAAEQLRITSLSDPRLVGTDVARRLFRRW